jgi:inner membrane protein
VLARSHVAIATATWAAIWWRPIALGTIGILEAPLVAPPGAGTAGSALLTLGCVALGALLPDLDHPRAWLAQWSLGRHGLLHLIRPFALPSAVLREEFGHRGALHSLLAALVLFAGLRALDGSVPGAAQVGAALAWGYALHVAADLLTNRGVPLLFPFWRRRWHLPWPLAVRTGSLGEALYVLVTLALAVGYAIGGAYRTSGPA